MNNVLWCCGSDGKYREKAEPYLQSLVRNADLRPMHFTVDYNIHELAGRKADINILHGVEYLPLESNTFRAKSPINCLQHGDFLPSFHCMEERGTWNPTIVFTDCDIYCQRELWPEEEDMLERWPEGTVGVQWNNGEGDSMLHEALRLGPLDGNLDAVLKCFQWPRHPMYCQIYNTGVLVARKSTYQLLFEKYVEFWPAIDPLFSGYAKQQFLLSYLLNCLDDEFTVKVLPETFHTHGCFNMVRPPPKRFNIFEDGLLSVNGDTVLLRHNWSA